MSEKKDTVRVSQVMAAAMAAVTAAVLGSTMGVAGTVVGAALASVVSTVGGAVYLRSIQRTKDGARKVKDTLVARAGSTRVMLGSAEERETAAQDDPTDEQQPADTDTEQGGETAPERRRPFGWPAVLVGSVVAFVLGMLVITGVEWIKGEPLSGGDGTTLGDIVRTDRDGGGDQNQAPAPTTTTTTTTTEAPTTTTAPPSEDHTSEPPTTSSKPPTTTTTTTTDQSEPSDPGTPPPAP